MEKKNMDSRGEISDLNGKKTPESFFGPVH
jgi:hypothetical protein